MLSLMNLTQYKFKLIKILIRIRKIGEGLEKEKQLVYVHFSLSSNNARAI